MSVRFSQAVPSWMIFKKCPILSQPQIRQLTICCLHPYVHQHHNDHHAQPHGLFPSLKRRPLWGAVCQQLQQHKQQQDISSFQQHLPTWFAFHDSLHPACKLHEDKKRKTCWVQTSAQESRLVFQKGKNTMYHHPRRWGILSQRKEGWPCFSRLLRYLSCKPALVFS